MWDMYSSVAAGLLLPFAGTALGAAMVFLLKNELAPRIEKFLLGFAAGVMIAASVWSLIIPGIEMAESSGGSGLWSAAGGFIGGVAFLFLLDTFVPHMHVESGTPEGVRTKLGKNTMLFFAVTLHNIPEGMAVGAVFAGMMADNAAISLTAALALSIGIAIQNFPEGAIISMPMRSGSDSRLRPFLYGAASGAVEPLAAILTILLSRFVGPVLPFLMSFAAGAMFYVVVEELIPGSQTGKHSNAGTIGAAAGFALMMVLDVALG